MHAQCTCNGTRNSRRKSLHMRGPPTHLPHGCRAWTSWRTASCTLISTPTGRAARRSLPSMATRRWAGRRRRGGAGAPAAVCARLAACLGGESGWGRTRQAATTARLPLASTNLCHNLPPRRCVSFGTVPRSPGARSWAAAASRPGGRAAAAWWWPTTRVRLARRLGSAGTGCIGCTCCALARRGLAGSRILACPTA